jgi:hypothetical protein
MKFTRHEDLEVPPWNAIIWRYMGLDKFLDLITQHRLFFTNATHLTDRYEVSLPVSTVQAKRKELLEEGISGPDLEKAMADFEEIYREMRESTLVNCWSLGRYESYALWKIYLGGSKAGVAIRTNINNLENSIDAIDDEIYIGKVKYTDFLREKDTSRVSLVTTKREFYEYEQELRLFILHPLKSEGGVTPPHGRYVSVDVDLLIPKLYLSPFVGPWFRDSFKSVLEKVSPKLAERIVESSIRDK